MRKLHVPLTVLLLCCLLPGCTAAQTTSLPPQSEPTAEPEPVVSAVEAEEPPEEPAPGPAFGGAEINAANLRAIESNGLYSGSASNGVFELKEYGDWSADFYYVDFTTAQRHKVGLGGDMSPYTQGAFPTGGGSTTIYALDGSLYLMTAGYFIDGDEEDEHHLAGVRRVAADTQPVSLPENEIFEYNSRVVWDGERFITMAFTMPTKTPEYSLFSLHPETGEVTRLIEFEKDGLRYALVGVHPDGLLVEQSEAVTEEEEYSHIPRLAWEQNRKLLLYSTTEDTVTEILAYRGARQDYLLADGGLYRIEDGQVLFYSWGREEPLAEPAQIPLPQDSFDGELYYLGPIYGNRLQFSTYSVEEEDDEGFEIWESWLYTLNLATGEVAAVPKRVDSGGGVYTEAFIFGGNGDTFLLKVGDKGYMGTERVFALCGQEEYWTGEGAYQPVTESDTILPLEDITI